MDAQNKWKILIIDDQEEVHNITRLVLKNLEFKGRGVNFFSAYNETEAKEILDKENDIAIALIDIVMENEDSGLRLVKYIRDDLKNLLTRIIIRTGQPGQAPEQQIIIDYEINSYKEKTDLSSQKLLTSIIATLRSYDYVKQVSDLNNELEKKVLERTEKLTKANNQLLKSLMKLEEDQEAGRKLQNRLLPKTGEKFDKYTFNRKLIPSIYLSGDFVDYFRINENKTAFYIADVSGHGVSSAFITVLLKNMIDHLHEQYLLSNEETILDPKKLLDKINKSIMQESTGKHLTLFYGIIDMKENSMCFSNAGHYPYPFLFTKKDKYFIEKKGNPVGLISSAYYENNKIDLEDEFVLLLMSDGILEILENSSLDEKKLFIKNSINSLDVSIEKIIKSLKIDSIQEIPDDLTFLLIKKEA